jgi:hypothetical protein
MVKIFIFNILYLRFYTLKESKNRIPKIYDFYVDFIPYIPSYARIEAKDILIKNLRRKNKVNELIKSPKQGEKYSTILDKELMKTTLEKNDTQDFSLDLILGEIEPYDSRQTIIKNFSLLENKNPFIKKKEISISNILNSSYQYSESSITLTKTLNILNNKHDSQTRPLSPIIHQRNKEQLYDSKIISNIQPHDDKKYNETFDILQDNNLSVSRVLNLSHIDAFNPNDDKTKDEDIHKNLIKKIVVNKNAIQKKNKKDNLNRHISNQFSISKRSPSRGIQSKSKSKVITSTAVQEAINIYRRHQNSKTQSNNSMLIVDFKSHLQTDHIIPPLFKKPMLKSHQTLKVDIGRKHMTSNKSVSSSIRINTKKDLFKYSNSNKNLQFNNVVNLHTQNTTENNFHANLSSRKEQIPVTINIIENSSSGLKKEINDKDNINQFNEMDEKINFTREKDRQPIYNISVNLNLNVSVTNNFSKSNNKKILSPKNLNPISPYTTKNSNKVKIFDTAFQSEVSSIARVLPLKKEENLNNDDNLTTQTMSMSHRGMFSPKFKNFQNSFNSKIQKEVGTKVRRSSNKATSISSRELVSGVNPGISSNPVYADFSKQQKTKSSKSIEKLYRSSKPVKLTTMAFREIILVS